MTTLRETAQAYMPPQTKNIVELDIVPVDVDLESREGTDKDGKAYQYNVLVQNGVDYRVPNSVLNQLQEQLKANSKLSTCKVTKKGEGLNTVYTVIPLN